MEAPGTDPAPQLFGTKTIGLTGNREVRQRTPLFDMLVWLSFVPSLIAIFARRPDFLALGAPMLVVLALALARWKPIEGNVAVGIDTPHLVEGDSFNVVLEVEAGSRNLERIEVELVLGKRLEALKTLRAVTTVPADSTQHLLFPMTADEWGIGMIERVRVRVTDRFGLFGGSIDREVHLPVRIGLPEDRLQASLEADRFRRVVGSHLSADRGQGMEIADIRAYLPGDSMRDINWRITNRRREPWVTLRHPDRSATVVVIVDAHDAEGDAQSTSQRRSVTAALALTRGHLANHDPVGLLVVGHSVRWLPPRLGRNQMYRIADELISVSDAPDASLRMYRPPAVNNIGSEAIIVAVTPLRDPFMASLLAELRSRGNPVAVLVPEVEEEESARSPLGFENRATGLARRLATAEQAIAAQSLRARGVVMVPWRPDQPVTAVIAAVRHLRSSIRRVVH